MAADAYSDNTGPRGTTSHRSVMLEEVLELLDVRPGGTYVDGTLGGGGHSREILERSGPDGRVLGLDRDPQELAETRAALSEFGNRLRPVHGSFETMDEAVSAAGWGPVDGVLMDLGVSSDQLDRPERGFSLMKDGPLDMRMDPTTGMSAQEWINQTPVVEMARVFRLYGEEPQASKVARWVAEERARGEIINTEKLADLVSRAKGGRRGKRHPATKVFQAVRMAVNDELGHLERGLVAALRVLRQGGRLVVISFHSLEDRMVKQFVKKHEGRMESLQQGGERWVGEAPRVERVNRKVLRPSDIELRENPRSRSARVRAATLLEQGDLFETNSNLGGQADG